MSNAKESSLKKILSYAGGRRYLTITGCILSGAAAVLGLVPYICVWAAARDVLAVFPDVAAAGGSGGLVKWGWMAVLFAAANIVLYFAALMCTHIAAFRTARNIRRAGMAHVMDLPLGFFTGNQSGRLRKLIDDNAGLTEDLLAHKLPDLTAAILTPVAGIVMLFLFDWRMGLLCLLTMVLAVVCMCMMMGGKNAGFFHRYQQEIEKMSAEAVEYVRGIPVVKVFQQTVYSFKAFQQAIEDYSAKAEHYQGDVCRVPQSINLTFTEGAFLFLVPVVLFLAPGALASGDYAGFVTNFAFYAVFSAIISTALAKIMFAASGMMLADTALGRIQPVMDAPTLAVPEHPQTPKDNRVVFRDVSFTYDGAQSPALSHVSFTADPGQTVALVGPSGGGKTTAASLIPRFWDADSGTVEVGGVDVRRIDPHVLMDQVAFVFQNNRLFKASVLDNVRAARPDASREQILAALEAAQCGDILEKLPQGLDTVIGTEGTYLSGGEAQRIALARAILKDAPIVVLDEATAFADPENEALIQKAFARLTKDRTVIMIAHRLSTVVGADKILVLEGGRVTEQGTHEEMIAAGGLYTRMWADYNRAIQWKMESGKEER